jgi:hypothetical protein
MKPCSRRRKRIAWLALGALDAREATDLRAHLQTCAGCRHYLEQISNVANRLSAVKPEPDIRTSETFHRALIGRLRAEESGEVSEIVAARLRPLVLNWRVVLPVIGAAAVVFAALSLVAHRRDVSLPAPAPSYTASKTKDALDPTVSNYQMVANRSLDELDELLARQGNRNPPSPALLTATPLSRANALP